MRNKDEIKQKKMEAAQALASAMKGGDEQKIKKRLWRSAQSPRRESGPRPLRR